MKTNTSRLISSRPLPTAICKLLLTIALIYLPALSSFAQERLTIAANGGGSGPLADTLAAVTMTGLSEVDFVELNLAVTSDDQVVIFPQPTLDKLTNVSQLFPERSRDDGANHITDFTLQELRQLRRTATASTTSQATTVPVAPSLGIPSLKEILGLLRTIEHQQGGTIGIVPNIRFVKEYKKDGKDVSRLVVAMLVDFGYGKDHPVMLQSTDGDELQRIKEELLPLYGIDIPLVQRLDNSAGDDAQSHNPLTAASDHSWIFTHLGLRMVSTYADALILPGSFVHKGQPSPLPPGFIDDARTLGLELFVVPSPDAEGQLPDFSSNYDDLLDYYYNELGLDGILTAEPAKALGYLERLTARNQEKLRKLHADRQVPPISVYLQQQAVRNEGEAPPAPTNL